MFEEIKKPHKDNLEQKDKQFKLLEIHVKESLKQNQRLISSMEKIIKKNDTKQQNYSEESD